jgi:ubiquinone/menaquinone biosynthesis C-methylase UbiE
MTGLDPAGTSDFSRVAGRYDATRDVPQKQLKSCYERLVHQGLLPSSGEVLDAGCGTGQISVVLAEMGYRVQGVDISPDMVALAQAKCRREWCARYSVADVRALPQSSGYFDAVVVSKLLMHVEDWQTACRELVRVLRPGACIFQLNDAASFEQPVHRYFAQRQGGLGLAPRGINGRAFSPRSVGSLRKCSWFPWETCLGSGLNGGSSFPGKLKQVEPGMNAWACGKNIWTGWTISFGTPRR